MGRLELVPEKVPETRHLHSLVQMSPATGEGNNKGVSLGLQSLGEMERERLRETH